MQALYARYDCILSAVTASSTLAVAQEAAQHPYRRRVPGPQLRIARHQQQAAALIEARGAHYVEAG